MSAPLSGTQFSSSQEAAQRKRGRQWSEPGYAGIGYNWYMYPLYLGTMQGIATPAPVDPNVDGTPVAPDSRIADAAEGAGMDASGLTGIGF